MSIYSSSVKRPITTMMIFAALIVMGLYSATRLPIDFFPEMEMPMMMVATTYSGASAADIETNVTKRVEDALNAVENLNKITSTSRDNMSMIVLEFEWGTDLSGAANDIRDQLEFIKDFLPDGADSPILYKFSTSMMPILNYSITADESYDGLEKIIDDKVINVLNRIDGIGSVGLSGVPGREIYVEVDPRKLDAYNLSVEVIGQMIGAENMNMPSGNLKMGDFDYQLRVQGEFSDSYMLQNIVLGTFQGQTIYLKDVAVIRDSAKDQTVDERLNGARAMRMFVQKQSGGNTVAVAADVKAEMEKIKETLPEDVSFELFFDSSEYIEQSISNLSRTLLWALLFVILVVLMFLGRWRATLIVAITIPISLIAAFIYLYAVGGSINIISLASLSIAIGMVVDDAIVVLENISKHIDRGARPRSAAIYATNEVWLAVIVTTLVIVAVFLPLTMVGGMVGIMFKQLGWVVTITTITSTITAISLTPMLSSRWLKKMEPKKAKGFSLYHSTDRVLGKIENGYVKSISWALKHRWTVLIGSVVILTGSFSLMGIVGTDFMPQQDQSRVSASIELQTGLRLEETQKVARQLEGIIQERYPETKRTITTSGSEESGLAAIFGSSGSNKIEVTMQLIGLEERDRSCFVIGNDLRKQLEEIPEIVNSSITYSGGGPMSGDNGVKLEIYGYDFDVTNDIAAQFVDRLKNINGATDINITREEEKPELQLILDREKLAFHGLNTATVSMAVRNRVDGMLSSLYREEGEEYNIIVRYGEEYRNSISDIENISILNQQGQLVRVSELGEVKEYWGPPNIEHKRRQRMVTVSTVPYEVNLGDFVKEIQAELKDVELPNEVVYEITGAYEDQQESFADLGMLLGVVILLVYIVMASQFESFKMPLIIMISIPFSFAGVIIALYLTGMTLTMVASLGAVLLVGIVVKNGIVMVDYINLMRDRGMAVREAIVAASKSRLRPVLMTALTTALGMLPMALSSGDGAEVWSPMGVAVIGGLVFSTFITMILIPTIYTFFTRKGERDKKKHHKKFNFLNELDDSDNPKTIKA